MRIAEAHAVAQKGKSQSAEVAAIGEIGDGEEHSLARNVPTVDLFRRN
jgi:hypothetical protein